MSDPTGGDAMLVSSAIERAFAVATALVAGASVIAALTPTPRDDGFIGRVYRVVEILAFNFGRAKDVPPNRSGGRFTAS
jgi:hypothetical protein